MLSEARIVYRVVSMQPVDHTIETSERIAETGFVAGLASKLGGAETGIVTDALDASHGTSRGGDEHPKLGA